MIRPVSALALLALVGCFDNLSSVRPSPEGLSTTTIDAVAFDAVYVVNGESSSISVINAETNTVSGTIALRGVAYPHDVTLSRDARLLGIAIPGYDMSSGET